MTPWRRSRIPIPRPSDEVAGCPGAERDRLRARERAMAGGARGPEGRCPHCGAECAIVDFQVTRCPNVDGCRYGDRRRAEEVARVKAERERREADGRVRGWWA